MATSFGFMKSRRAVCTALAALILTGFVGVEVYHRLANGHFASVGLHVDVLWTDHWIGGPELSRMYWPVLTNFGVWPATLEVCNYLTDTSNPGTDYAVGLQHWNAHQRRWDLASDISLEELCGIAIPTSRGVGTLETALLWPGFSVDATGPEAIGARGDFEGGDLARFVIFRTADRSPDSGTAAVSDAFVVEGDPLHGLDVRTKH